MKTAVYRSQSGTIRAASFDAMFITVLTGGTVPDVEFDEFLQWGQQFKIRVSLSWAQDTQITATQRNRALKAVRSRNHTLRSVMLTESKLIQGIVTAFSWFVDVKYAAYPPDQVDAALAWLHEASPLDMDRARRVLRELLDEVETRTR